MSEPRKHRNYVGGTWVDSPGEIGNVNPSDTGDIVGLFAQADEDLAAQAVEAAAAGTSLWAQSTPQERFNALDFTGSEILKRKEELGMLLSREEGKTLPEGIGEVTRAGHIFKWFAGEALRLSGEHQPSVRPGIDVDVLRQPLGVIGIITPWNFPIAIPAWKIAPALAFGNSVVFKPADLAPGSAWAVAEILSRSGMPEGVFNLVMGRGRVVGEA
ncbi:MAG: aldehyde dehydrogenase family protein, partial [Bacteroidota bacterium]